MAKTPEELLEKGFEEYIEEHLLRNGYVKGSSYDYNKEYALDTKILFEFLGDTQPKKMDKLRQIPKDQYKLHYSTKNENSIDMLICVNGLPVAVLELENAFTGQTYEDAIIRYKKDRSHNELFFQFKKRTIVFFAVDTSEAI